MSDQLQFSFDGPSREEFTTPGGLDSWREKRRAATEALAAKQGLPLGRKVRVEFENGPSLSGVLFLDESTLFLPEKRNNHLALRIGTATFHADEIASCICIE